MTDWIRADKIEYTVLVDGTDVTEYVQLPLRCSYGFDLRIAEATLRFRDIPGTLTNWSTVQIYMGRTGTGTTGNVLRFDGYAFDTTFELWPYTLTVPCKGPLILAEITEPQTDAWFDREAYRMPSLAEYLAPGINLWRHPDTGALWRDQDMVAYVLDRCGLTSKIDPNEGIQGLEKILGSTLVDQYVWKRGQSGLQWIETLDSICLGFRTFDTPTGIKRIRISPNTPFEANRIDTNEAVHLLEGTVLTVQQAQCRNRIVISGVDWGAGPYVYMISEPFKTPSPPGVGYVTYQFSSPMIEFDLTQADGRGISCQEVAEWQRDEHNNTFFDGTVVTWLDSQFYPGWTAYLNAPHLGGPNFGAWSGEGTMQSMWIRRVDTEISESGAFTQRVGLRSKDYYNTQARPLGPLSLPAGLKVVP